MLGLWQQSKSDYVHIWSGTQSLNASTFERSLIATLLSSYILSCAKPHPKTKSTLYRSCHTSYELGWDTAVGVIPTDMQHLIDFEERGQQDRRRIAVETSVVPPRKVPTGEGYLAASKLYEPVGLRPYLFRVELPWNKGIFGFLPAEGVDGVSCILSFFDCVSLRLMSRTQSSEPYKRRMTKRTIS